MHLIAAVCAGIALAAACGFRVFLPLLGMSIAAAAGVVPPPAGMAWIGSVPALVMFGVATAVEVVAYYVPWLDHMLDTITSPGSVVAGVLVAAAAMPDVPPEVRWTLAVIGGGGAAATVQGGTVMTRAVSGVTTGGVGNPIVSTLELVGSITLVVLAIVVPVLAAALVVALFVWVFRLIGRYRAWRRGRAAVAVDPAGAV